jgi:ribosomal protein S26
MAKNKTSETPVNEIFNHLTAQHVTADDLFNLVDTTAREMALDQQIKFLLDQGLTRDEILEDLPTKVQCQGCHRWIDQDRAVWIQDHWDCYNCDAKRHRGVFSHNRYCHCDNCGTQIPNQHATCQYGRRIGQYCCKIVPATVVKAMLGKG